MDHGYVTVRAKSAKRRIVRGLWKSFSDGICCLGSGFKEVHNFPKSLPFKECNRPAVGFVEHGANPGRHIVATQSLAYV